MRETYPDYRKEGITINDLYSKLPQSEKTIIDNFLKYCSVTAGENKLKDIRANIVQFRDIVGKSLLDIELSDLVGFLSVLNKSDRKEWTKNGIKMHIKKFIRWQFKDWSSKFNGLEVVKLNKGLNEQKVNENNLITAEELEKILRICERLRDKALVILLYETGARPQEIRNLKWKDIKLDEGETAKVHLYSGKTETARVVLIKEAIVHLKRWKQEYSYPNVSNNDLVFPSPRDRKEPITRGTLSAMFNRLGKKAKIGRELFPYLMRHSRLNELYKVLPEQIHKKFAGHSRDSKMTGVYSHLSSEDVTKSLLEKVFHVEEITKEQQNKYDKEIAELKKEQVKSKKFEEFVRAFLEGKEWKPLDDKGKPTGKAFKIPKYNPSQS